MANPEKIVTREVVFEVANQLKADGIEPTNRKLLHQIGGGSMTTIAGHLRDWKNQQDTVVSSVAVLVPPTVAKVGTEVVATIWQTCIAEAKREFESVTEQATQRVQYAEDERDRVLIELAEAEAELVSERQEIVALKTLLTQEREKFLAMQDRAIQAQADADKAHSIVSEIEIRAVVTSDSLKLERERSERLQTEIDLQSKTLAQLREEVAAAREIAVELATEKKTNISLTEQLTELKKRGSAEILRMSERVQKVEAERGEAIQEAKEAVAKANKLTGQLEQLRKQVDIQTGMIQKFAAQNNDKKPKGGA